VISLDFRGKSGKRHQVQVEDARVARVVRRCLDLPGQILFQYQDADALRSISAQDVNEYLRRISGAAITSKDFRTWGATVCVAARLAGADRAGTKAQMHRHMRDAINTAAKILGNTPAVCKRSYIDPAVFDHYEAGTKFAVPAVPGMRKAECVVAAMLGARTRRRTTASNRDASRAGDGARARRARAGEPGSRPTQSREVSRRHAALS
jgi:DNA topoisomerase I